MRDNVIKSVVVAIFLFNTSFATTYYVKMGGNDTGTGRSWSQAWATVNKVNTTIAKGDSVFFGTGTWYGYPILPPSGTGTAWTVYSCSTHTVATKNNPQIRSGDLITGWTQYSGNVYRASWNATGGYSDGGNVNACQTMVQVDADEMLVSVGSIANVNQVGEFYYDQPNDYIYAWAWGGGDPDQYTLYASVKPVVWLRDGNKRNIEFFGLDLQGGKQGVVLWDSGINTDNVRFIHCHVAKAGHLNHENPAAFFSEANYGIVQYDSTLIRACSLGYAIQENPSGWSDATGHGGATDFYSTSNSVVESCYVYGYSANGIAFKFTSEGVIIRYNYIDGTYNRKGITLYRDYCDAEVYGNILVNGFSSVAMDIGAKDDGDTYGAHNVKIYNNTLVNYDELGLMLGNFDWESPVIFSGDCQIKYNLFWGYTHDGSNGDYADIDIGYHPWCTAYGDTVDIDSNAYYSSTDAFAANCNNTARTWSTWRSACGEDPNGRNYNYQLNPSTFALPETTSLIMNRTYGGRTWTRYGAVQSSQPDTTDPVITNVRATDIVTTGAIIRWTTNEPATSQVNYGLTTSYGNTTPLDQNLVTSHADSITGLTANTLYHYRVRSRDASGNEAVSGDYTFTTAPVDITPPLITNVTITGLTSNSAAIGWTTNEAATTQAQYGPTSGYGSNTPLDNTLVVSHTATIIGLSPNTLYHFRAVSRDGAGNLTNGRDSTFTTLIVSAQNLAQGIAPTVCGSYQGYSPARITDGVVNPYGGTATTWASDESATTPHWVEINFSGSRNVERVVVDWAWNTFQSAWMRSQQYSIQRWNGSSFVDIITVSPASSDTITTTSFTPVTTARIRIYQPAGMGPIPYTAIMWLTELEIWGVNGSQDTIPPAAIIDLGAVPGDGHGKIGLNWTAPGDDGQSGVADNYVIKYSNEFITEASWPLALPMPDPPAPLDAGTAQACTVDGLAEGEIYYLAIRSYDDAGNESELSNIPEAFASGISPPEPISTVPDSDAGRVTLTCLSVDSYYPLYYIFELDSTSSFTHPSERLSILSDSLITVVFDSVMGGIDYFWRCHAIATNNSDTSDWSDITNFRLNATGVDGVLLTDDCLTPAPGQAVFTNRPTFVVRRPAGATIIYFQVADNNGFASAISSGPIAAADSLVSWRPGEPLEKAGSFFWRASVDNRVWTLPINFAAELDIHPYPNPFRASDGNSTVTFINLPLGARITIATVSGSIVKTVDNVGNSGEWTWDLGNNSGHPLASGIYLYVVDFPSGSASGKIMVIR